jgi:DNA-binding LacI/PurR family transcriptional regulator
MQGMCEEAQRLSHRIELVHMRGGDLSRWETADVLGARGLDALICIQPPQVFPVALVRLVERGLPVVLTGRGFVGLPVPVVRDDVEAGARLVADWMAERGRTRLVALVGHRADLHTRPRIDALRRILRERGLDLPGGAVRTLYFGGPEPPYGYENDTASMRAHRFLREAGGFDAVFTMSTPSLRAVARYREAECRDLSVVHLEQADVPARQACPGIPVSLLAPPLAALGREAIRVTESQCGIDPEGESPSLAPTLDPAP